jgi:hypothetical protein
MTREEQRRTSKRVHVISRKHSWAVKKEGLSRASKVYRTKETAVVGARRLKKAGHDVIVHKRDGSIERWEKAARRI